MLQRACDGHDYGQEFFYGHRIDCQADRKTRKEIAVLQRMVGQGVAKFPQDKMQLVEAGTCLNCGDPIGESRLVRGCHEYCYKAIMAAIKDPREDLTEFDAIELGILLPNLFRFHKRLRPRQDTYGVLAVDKL